jgi:hypothetical protein
MLSQQQMGGQPRKPYLYTQNDIAKHLKTRRRGLRLSVQSSAKKFQTNPQPRNRIGTRSVCSLWHLKRSVPSKDVNTCRNEKPEYHNQSHPIHQQPQSPNTSILLSSDYLFNIIFIKIL